MTTPGDLAAGLERSGLPPGEGERFAGAVRLQGHVPSGQRFKVKIPRIWAATEVDAMVQGENLGPAGPAHPQRWLGGFALPNRGLFAIGTATFETYRPERHVQVMPTPAAPSND